MYKDSLGLLYCICYPLLHSSNRAFSKSSVTRNDFPRPARGIYQLNLESVNAFREDLIIRQAKRTQPYVRLGAETLTTLATTICFGMTLECYPALGLLTQKEFVVRRSTKQKCGRADGQFFQRLYPVKTAWFNLNYSGGAGHMGKPFPTYPKLKIIAPCTTLAFRSCVSGVHSLSSPQTFQVSSVQSGSTTIEFINPHSLIFVLEQK